MSWVEWHVAGSAAQTFCEDVLLVLPLLGLSYLIQDRDTLASTGEARFNDDAGRKGDTRTPTSLSVAFFLAFTAGLFLGGCGTLSIPRPWLLASAFCCLLVCSFVLFSRFGVYLTRRLLRDYDALGSTRLAASYERLQPGLLAEIARKIAPDLLPRARTRSRTAIAWCLVLLFVQMTAVLLVAAFFAVRLYWFTRVGHRA